MTVRGEDKIFEGRKGKKRRKRKGGNVRAIVITNDLPQSPHTCSGDSWKERLWTAAIITSKPHWGVGKLSMTRVRWISSSTTIQWWTAQASHLPFSYSSALS